MPKRGVHDMGGEAAGAIDTHEHTPTMTERRIDAMMQLLRLKPRSFWTTDENRRTIESLTPKHYRDSTYYERWTFAMRGLLIEKGVLTEAEIEKRLADVKARLGKAARGKSGRAKSAARVAKSGAKPAAKQKPVSAPAPRSAAKSPAAKSKGRSR